MSPNWKKIYIYYSRSTRRVLIAQFPTQVCKILIVIKAFHYFSILDYYLKPFHAYEDGNLSWQSAMEVESAALTVHAHIFSPPSSAKRILRRDGDFVLRENFHVNMKQVFDEKGFVPHTVLDLGCSTGLSTLKLLSSFPQARVTGLDLSPYYIAGVLSLLRFQNLYLYVIF